MLLVADDAQHVVGRGVDIEPHDLDARDHHRADLAIVEAEHVAHHLVLLRLDDARVDTFFQARSDLFFSHAAHVAAVDAHQRERAFGAHRQQLDERPRDERQHFHRRGHQASDVLGVHLADALGHQLAEDDREDGDDDDDHRGGGDRCGAIMDREGRMQPARERLGERRVADDAVEDADRGDADLHHREELGRVVVQVHRGLRARVAGLHHHLQPRFAARGQRHLRHREQGVEQNQEDQKGNVHAGRASGGRRQRSRIMAESHPRQAYELRHRRSAGRSTSRRRAITWSCSATW